MHNQSNILSLAITEIRISLFICGSSRLYLTPWMVDEHGIWLVDIVREEPVSGSESRSGINVDVMKVDDRMGVDVKGISGGANFEE